ncbi:nickel-type superoxide dismutase maturation protease [Calothrix rhizosoleniae]|uniref:nickel-type superoxide dismutase maturation protease n=1 Tax=Calothrix rhizosoleniae TaxID=888997 RepID=UPI000B498F06|nr:nickel-type superoxide dismutase maturation protease [Calothrix rhizosoleniae]
MLEEIGTGKKLLLLLLGVRRRLRITGSSMIPLLQPGEEILFNPQAYQQKFPQEDDIVVAQHPFQNQKIVKRVAVVLEDGSCFLIGDNPLASTDSRSYGFVTKDKILGQVTHKFP